MRLLFRLTTVSLPVLLAACGGGTSSSAGSTASLNPPLGPGTTVTVRFVGAPPNAAAVSTASGIFVSAMLSGNTLSFLVPAGSDTYAVAVACPAVTVTGTLVAETVIAANLSDGTSYSVAPCLRPVAATGAATGTYDISAIPGAVRARIVGALGFRGDVNGIAGAFNVSMPIGTNDIAVLALGVGGNVLAARILRAQAVPGATNGAAPIIVSTADQTTNEPVTIAGVPLGFARPPALSATYLTSNGTYLTLSTGSAFQYQALSFADISALDQYQISTNSTNTAINETIGTALFSSTGAAVTLNYPPPWTFTVPAAAQFPTFSFAYSGFAGLASQTYRGQIAWQTGGNVTNQLTVFATGGFLGMQTSVPIPNLGALPGFFGSAPSGTAINWLSQIDGGSFPSYVFPPPTPGSLSFVQTHGTYIEP